jgi:hypothetical protein
VLFKSFSAASLFFPFVSVMKVSDNESEEQDEVKDVSGITKLCKQA